MIDGRHFSIAQPVKINLRAYENIRKLQQVKEMIKQPMIAIDLSKQQALDADQKAVQLINFLLEI